MPDTWRVSPFIKPLPLMTAPDGSCGYPDDLPHCHNAETQHIDGIAECFGYTTCDAPGPGHHAHVHPCEPQFRNSYTHHCTRCR